MSSRMVARLMLRQVAQATSLQNIGFVMPVSGEVQSTAVGICMENVSSLPGLDYPSQAYFESKTLLE